MCLVGSCWFNFRRCFYAIHEDLAPVGRGIANLQVGESTDPQLDDQKRDGNLRGRCRVVRVSRLPYSVRAATSFENRTERVLIDGVRQPSWDPHVDTGVGKWGGQGAVPTFTPGIVQLECYEPALDGRGQGAKLRRADVGDTIMRVASRRCRA